jgi:hypothetical protein
MVEIDVLENCEYTSVFDAAAAFVEKEDDV